MSCGWISVQYGDSMYNADALTGSWIQYLNAGDYVRLAYTRTGAGVTPQFAGDQYTFSSVSDGSQCWFSIAGCENTT